MDSRPGSAGGSPALRRERQPTLLYLGGFELPVAQARGIQTLHTAHALARAGWRVRVLAQRPARARGSADVSRAVLGAYGLEPHPRLDVVTLPVVRVPAASRLEIHARLAVTNWSYGLRCLLDLLKSRPRPGLVLARDPRLAWLFLKTRRLHRRPVVYEVHEIFSTRPRDNRSLEPGEVRGVADRTRALERAVFGAADLLLPLTRACADLLATDFAVPPAQLVVVPDGTVAPSGPLPARDPARGVVYAGQLYRWKGVDVLLDAVARAPDARLTVFGGLPSADAPDPDLAACRSLADRLGLADRVSFAGFLPHARVRAAIAGAAAGVVPLPDRLMSRYFTSPLKVFDYMAAGVPIVASDLPALREVLRDGSNALLAPAGDAAALAAALGRLLHDPALAERLRARAFADVAAYTWERRAERIIDAVAPLFGGYGLRKSG
jgi:glycosyltransferase involved in cell wall biosynthesis